MATVSAIGPRPRRLGVRTLRGGGLSLRVDVGVVALSLGLAVILAGLMVWAASLGDYRLSFAEVVRAARGHGPADQVLVVRDVRLPRICSAALVGAGLAVSGALFQGVVRNPLASPDIVGVNQGAGCFAVLWIVLGLRAGWLPAAAVVGAMGAAAAVYALSWRRGIRPARLILVGIGAGAAFQAATTFLTVRYPIERVRPAMLWLLGSLAGSDWSDVRIVAVAVALGVPAAVVFAWPLSAMQLGDDTARGLGLPLERTRLALLAVGCGLAAAAVAVAGPVGFVALMVPRIARMLIGPPGGAGLLFTGLLGACYVVVADMTGQHWLPVALPVGVVTSALGAPYFLLLLARSDGRA